MDDYPLYYEAFNEKGLGIAGLNFVGNAVYFDPKPEKDNIAQFELIPWILGTCASLAEAKESLSRINLISTPFKKNLPLAQLHWIIADASGAITVESTADGLHVYDNPVGVLTNNPPFPMQMFSLNNYLHLSPKQPANTFSNQLDLSTYSRGMGGLGLPGDLSSASRFARVAFVKQNSISGNSETESVSQFFHIPLALLINREDAVRWRTESMRSRSILPAAMRRREFTIIRRMTIIRFLRLICTARISMAKRFAALRR